MIVNNGFFLIFWIVVFNVNGGTVEGITMKDVLYLWGLAPASWGLSNILFGGFRYINRYVLNGTLDTYFLQPKSMLFSVGVSKMDFGSMPNDGGYLSNYTAEEKENIVKQYPQAEELFRKIVGATEFINKKERWCLWLENISPNLLKSIPPIYDAVNNVYSSIRKFVNILNYYVDKLMTYVYHINRDELASDLFEKVTR